MKRYAIAAFIGLCLVLFASFSWGAFFYGVGNPHDAWSIPRWDTWQNLATPAMYELRMQAVLLRGSQYLLEHGYWINIASVGAACLLQKTTDEGKKSYVLWCLSRSLFIGISCVVGVSFLWGMSAGPNDSGVSDYWFDRLAEGIGDSYFLLMCATFSLIGPAFWLIIFICLLIDKPRRLRMNLPLLYHE